MQILHEIDIVLSRKTKRIKEVYDVSTNNLKTVYYYFDITTF